MRSQKHQRQFLNIVEPPHPPSVSCEQQWLIHIGQRIAVESKIKVDVKLFQNSSSTQDKSGLKAKYQSV